MEVIMENLCSLSSLPSHFLQILPSFVLILEEIAFLKFYEDIQRRVHLYFIGSPTKQSECLNMDKTFIFYVLSNVSSFLLFG